MSRVRALLAGIVGTLLVLLSAAPVHADYPHEAKAFKLPWLGHIVYFGNNPIKLFATQAKEVLSPLCLISHLSTLICRLHLSVI